MASGADANSRTDAAASFEAALNHLLTVLDQLSAERRGISRRAARIRRHLQAGRSLADIVGQEDQPLIVRTMRDATASLVDAFSRMQRAEALALHNEGMSMERIASLFGISRQRVAHLLRGPARTGV